MTDQTNDQAPASPRAPRPKVTRVTPDEPSADQPGDLAAVLSQFVDVLEVDAPRCAGPLANEMALLLSQARRVRDLAS